jgi:hypothetical protein
VNSLKTIAIPVKINYNGFLSNMLKMTTFGGIMKKVLSVVAVISFVMLYACGGGSSDDPKAVMDDFFTAMNDFYTAVDKAEDADAFIAALEKVGSDMKALAPRMKAVMEKYPELNMKDGKMPEAFKEYEEKFKQMMPKMMGLAAKMQKFAADPRVMEAVTKMQEAMKEAMQ